MCQDAWSSETADEEALRYLQQRVEELSEENKELRDIADTEKAKVSKKSCRCMYCCGAHHRGISM